MYHVSSISDTRCVSARRRAVCDQLSITSQSKLAVVNPSLSVLPHTYTVSHVSHVSHAMVGRVICGQFRHYGVKNCVISGVQADRTLSASNTGLLNRSAVYL